MNRISMEHKMNRTGDKLVTWTATGEPNWSYIPSAGKSSKTKEQFVSEIKNLAQKAYTSGGVSFGCCTKPETALSAGENRHAKGKRKKGK